MLTRDPVADRIEFLVVAALTRAKRHLGSELDLEPGRDGDPTTCVVCLDSLHIPRAVFRRHVTTLSPAPMARACRVLEDALGC